MGFLFPPRAVADGEMGKVWEVIRWLVVTGTRDDGYLSQGLLFLDIKRTKAVMKSELSVLFVSVKNTRLH